MLQSGQTTGSVRSISWFMSYFDSWTNSLGESIRLFFSEIYCTTILMAGWWFGTCFFPYIGSNNPNWRTPSFFGGVGQPPTRWGESKPSPAEGSARWYRSVRLIESYQWNMFGINAKSFIVGFHVILCMDMKSGGKPTLSQSFPAFSSMFLSVCLIFVGPTRVFWGGFAVHIEHPEILSCNFSNIHGASFIDFVTLLEYVNSEICEYHRPKWGSIHLKTCMEPLQKYLTVPLD